MKLFPFWETKVPRASEDHCSCAANSRCGSERDTRTSSVSLHIIRVSAVLIFVNNGAKAADAFFLLLFPLPPMPLVQPGWMKVRLSRVMLLSAGEVAMLTMDAAVPTCCVLGTTSMHTRNRWGGLRARDRTTKFS